MYHSNYLEISRGALRANATAVCNAVCVPVIGMLKCNGYGVTVCEAAAAWQAAGVTMFGVSRPEEAISLRQLGFQEDILLLCPVADRKTLVAMQENHIIVTISSFENALFYSAYVTRPLRVHIAIDTGMGRFGIRWDDVQQVRAIYELPDFIFEGIFSHFSSSFEPEYSRTALQLSRFLALPDALREGGYPVGMRHIANSCAALRFPETRLDAVRIGSALVGKLWAATPVKLEPVSIFKARVMDCKYLQPGDTTGYGGYCKIRKHTKAVVVALGREDGFGTVEKPDHLRFWDLAAYICRMIRQWRHPPCVICKGKELPVLGRIGNQYTLFDATGTEVSPGDQVQWEGNLMLSSCERRFV